MVQYVNIMLKIFEFRALLLTLCLSPNCNLSETSYQVPFDIAEYCDLEIQAGGHLPWKFMHNMYIAEFYRPGAIFLPGIVWVCLHLLLDRRLQKMLYSISWCITVSQDHRSVQDITIYRSNLWFLLFLPTKSCSKPLLWVFCVTWGTKFGLKKLQSPGATCL